MKRKITKLPQSCDTFVVLPDSTKSGHIIFGKNSDRPQEEVQEIKYFAAQDFSDGDKLQVHTIKIKIMKK